MEFFDSLSEMAGNVIDQAQNQVEISAADWFKQQLAPKPQQQSTPTPVVMSAVPAPTGAAAIQTIKAMNPNMIYLILAGVGLLAVLLFKGK